MEKQKKQLIVLLIILIIAAAAFLILSKIPPKEDEDSEEESYTLNDLNAEEVTDFVITNEDKTLTLKKNGDEWKCEEYSDKAIDTDKVTSILKRLLPIQSENRIENITDYSQYGFDAGKGSIEVKIKNGEKGSTISIGDYNNITSSYYCIVTEMDSNTVYTLEGSFVNNIDITIDDITASETDTETTETENEVQTEAETESEPQTES